MAQAHTPHVSKAAAQFLSPEEARERLVSELGLEEFDPKTQDELLSAAVEMLQEKIFVAVLSWVPEDDYEKIEALALDERDADVQALITKHVSPEKIVTIIDTVFEESVARYKTLLRERE